MKRSFKGRAILPQSQRKEFYKTFGYVVVPSVVSTSEVKQMRVDLLKEFAAKKFQRMLWPRDVLHLPMVYGAALRPEVAATLREVLGEDFNFFPSFQVQRNNFGRPGWHTDSGSEGNARYLMSRDYRFAKCGIYLQDNDPDWGGGIDVVPGGHKFPSRISRRFDFKLKYIANQVGRLTSAVSLDLKAGDLLIFDSRLPHAATWPVKLESPIHENSHIKNMPEEFSKYVVYWDVGAGEAAAMFQKNAEIRAAQEVARNEKERYFSDYLRYHWPTDYPPSFLEKAAAVDVTMASLDVSQAKVWQAATNGSLAES